MSSDRPTIPFHYIKSNLFRILHVDGSIGGVTPAGLVFFSLYSERAALPQVMVHEIAETGQVGEEQVDQRIGKTGVVRELEIGAIMNVGTAEYLVKWLNIQIDLAKKLKESASGGAKNVSSSL